jgi:hypothetical protein
MKHYPFLSRLSRRGALLACALLAVGLQTLHSAIINVSSADSYAKIEAARAGDEVVIAPGTYGFRLYFSIAASPDQPIVIRAQDPANKPVWDLSATLVENAPGSYTAGDRGRGGWQFSGASNYRISGIVFTGCRTAGHNSAAIRYYNGSTNLYFKDCVFRLNDNGITGGTQESEATVEFCEFDRNGNTAASLSAPTHNLYIYGGVFALRFCYVHDSVQAQNFHIRSRISTLEYNWFARAKSYEGDLMTDDDFSGSGAFTQTMLVRGNVFVQSAAPDNNSQVVVAYNDSRVANDAMSLRVINNTFVGNGGNAAFVHLSNADGTGMSAEVSNNLIFGTTRPTLVENAGSGSVNGRNNWLITNASAGPLTGSVRSATPGFRNPAAKDFTLAPGSAAIGAASGTVAGLPGLEYFQNETTARMYRIRPSAYDIGAFESSTAGNGTGPYDAAPRPAMTIQRAGGTALLGWPLFASDYLLDEISGLDSQMAWAQSAAPLVTNAGGIQTTAPSLTGGNFYRLRKP